MLLPTPQPLVALSIAQEGNEMRKCRLTWRGQRKLKRPTTTTKNLKGVKNKFKKIAELSRERMHQMYVGQNRIHEGRAFWDVVVVSAFERVRCAGRWARTSCSGHGSRRRRHHAEGCAAIGRQKRKGQGRVGQGSAGQRESSQEGETWSSTQSYVNTTRR